MRYNNIQDYSFLSITLFARLCMKVVILLPCGKQVHDLIASLRYDASPESEWSCICEISILTYLFI